MKTLFAALLFTLVAQSANAAFPICACVTLSWYVTDSDGASYVKEGYALALILGAGEDNKILLADKYNSRGVCEDDKKQFSECK